MRKEGNGKVPTQARVTQGHKNGWVPGGGVVFDHGGRSWTDMALYLPCLCCGLSCVPPKMC